MKITIRAKSELPKSYTYRDYRIYDNGTTFDVYEGNEKIAGDFETSDEAEAYVINRKNIKASESNKYDDWHSLSGADQTAVEYAISIMELGQDPETAARQAVYQINEANASDEYENEDFYQEEADYNRVYDYITKYAVNASTKITASSVDDSRLYKDLYRPMTEEEKIDAFHGDADAYKETYDEIIELYDSEGYEYLGTYISDDEFLRDAGIDIVDLVKTSNGDKRFVFTVSDSIYYADDEIDRAIDPDSEEYGYSSDEY